MTLLAFLREHRLDAEFYRRDCVAVARDLLGTILVRREEDDDVTAGVIGCLPPAPRPARP